MFKKIKKFTFRTLRKMRFLPSKMYVKYHYRYYTGKKMNLKDPKEFNEKIGWLKVYYRPKILNILVDKYAVRAYVKEKIGEKYLNECLGIYEDYKDIPFNELPKKFVIKATHASGYNLIVTDKTKINKKKVVKLFKKWANTNQYYRTGQEWAYKDVPPRFVVEKYLEEAGRGSLTDYKFYCFNGKPKFLELHLDRVENHKSSFYDLDFKQLPFRDVPLEECIDKDIPKPTNFDEMKKLAEKLADDFPFVRVDFYSISNKIIFGEMTFYPADARRDFKPDKYNLIIGDYMQLPKLS